MVTTNHRNASVASLAKGSFMLAIAGIVAALLVIATPLRSFADAPKVKQVFARGEQVAAIMDDDSLMVWGRYSHASDYRLSGSGAGSATYILDYANTDDCWPHVIENGTDVKDVYLGEHGGALIKNDGTLWMWGSNEHGQLGNGLMAEEVPFSYIDSTGAVQESTRTETHNSIVPQLVQGIDGEVKQVIVGDATTLAVTEDGKLYLWGCTSNGELDFSASYVYAPDDRVASPKLLLEGVDKASFTESTGDARIAVIKKDGTLWIWGDTYWHGACGLGTSKDVVRSPAPLLDGIKVADVQLGSSNGFALAENGDVYAWGNNGDCYVLGIGTVDDAFTPVKVPNLKGVTELRICKYPTQDASFAVCGDGSVWAWGSNSSGMYGNGTISTSAAQSKAEYAPQSSYTTPSKVEALPQNAATLLSSRYARVAIVQMRDGTLWGWGTMPPQLGVDYDSSYAQWRLTPAKLPVDNVASGATANSATFVIGNDGILYAIGHTQYGLFGGGVESHALVKVFAPVLFNESQLPQEEPDPEDDPHDNPWNEQKPSHGTSAPSTRTDNVGKADALDVNGATYTATARDEVTLSGYRGTARSFAIPATISAGSATYKVTAIGANAFAKSALAKIAIGKNVKAVGTKAFFGCKKLKKITIKSKKLTAKSVGKKAFSGIAKKATFKVPAKKAKAYKKLLVKRGASKKIKVRT